MNMNNIHYIFIKVLHIFSVFLLIFPIFRDTVSPEFIITFPTGSQ